MKLNLFTNVEDLNVSPTIANAMLGEWAKYPDVRPKEYGRYLVYRAGCKKMHFETWNNTGWAYNNNDITHWCDVCQPLA